jgi:hypothetical protein
MPFTWNLDSSHAKHFCEALMPFTWNLDSRHAKHFCEALMPFTQSLKLIDNRNNPY